MAKRKKVIDEIDGVEGERSNKRFVKVVVRKGLRSKVDRRRGRYTKEKKLNSSSGRGYSGPIRGSNAAFGPQQQSGTSKQDITKLLKEQQEKLEKQLNDFKISFLSQKKKDEERTQKQFKEQGTQPDEGNVISFRSDDSDDDDDYTATSRTIKGGILASYSNQERNENRNPNAGNRRTPQPSALLVKSNERRETTPDSSEAYYSGSNIQEEFDDSRDDFSTDKEDFEDTEDSQKINTDERVIELDSSDEEKPEYQIVKSQDIIEREKKVLDNVLDKHITPHVQDYLAREAEQLEEERNLLEYRPISRRSHQQAQEDNTSSSRITPLPNKTELSLSREGLNRSQIKFDKLVIENAKKKEELSAVSDDEFLSALEDEPKTLKPTTRKIVEAKYKKYASQIQPTPEEVRKEVASDFTSSIIDDVVDVRKEREQKEITKQLIIHEGKLEKDIKDLEQKNINLTKELDKLIRNKSPSSISQIIEDFYKNNPQIKLENDKIQKEIRQTQRELANHKTQKFSSIEEARKYIKTLKQPEIIKIAPTPEPEPEPSALQKHQQRGSHKSSAIVPLTQDGIKARNRLDIIKLRQDINETKANIKQLVDDYNKTIKLALADETPTPNTITPPIITYSISASKLQKIITELENDRSFGLMVENLKQIKALSRRIQSLRTSITEKQKTL